MKKKPALQAILDNMESYTVADLQKVKQPKWIKKHLLVLKQNGNARGYLSPREIAEIFANAKPIRNHDYKVYRYIGETEFIDTVEIMHGELVLLIDNKEVKVDHRCIDIALFDSNQLQFIDTIESVYAFVGMKNNDNWNRLCPGEDRVEKVVKSGPDKDGWEDNGGFKIRRFNY